MGLIKAAILIGAGGYAINKLSKNREGHSCGCKHNRNRDLNGVPNDVSNPNESQQQNAWTPGTKLRGPGPLPEYRDEKALPYQPRDSVSEKEGWVGSEKNNWVGNEKELGGMRGTNGA